MNKNTWKIVTLSASVLLLATLLIVGLATCGKQGEQGAQGEQGPAGINGENGADGKSAYEIAVDNGYEGTVQEWLASLLGATGADGKSAYDIAVENGFTGTQTEWLASLIGATGAQGDKGDKGDTGAQGEKGDKGDRGDAGAAGSNGQDGVGVTGAYVDENLHLWVELSNGTKVDAGYVGSIQAVQKRHTVIFLDYDGKLLGLQSDVEHGASATAPTVPERYGYAFTGWDTSIDNVKSDLIVKALYEKTYTDPTIIVGSITARAGETVEIKVDIKNNPGIAGAKFIISYDSKLTLTAASSGTAVEVLDYTAPASLTSPSPFNWDSLDAQSNADGTLLILTFKIAADATVGEELDVEISYTTGDVYDKDLNDVTLDLISGKITVE